jgi:hypothetical protein
MSNPKPFMVRRYITTQEKNHAMWVSARFEYASPREVELNQAEEFIRDLLKSGIELNSSDIRDAAHGHKISNERVSAALRMLEMRKLVSYSEGPRGAKLWRWNQLKLERPENELDPAGKVRQGQSTLELDLAGQGQLTPARSESDPAVLSIPPLGGDSTQAGAGGAAHEDST